MTQDVAVQGVVQNTLASMNVLSLAGLREAMTPILTAWASSVKLPDANGVLVTVAAAGHTDVPLLVTTDDTGTQVTDYAYEVTDEQGTYWKLGSGNKVHDAQDAVIDRPTFDQVMAQTTTNGTWTRLTGAQLDFLERYTANDNEYSCAVLLVA